MTSFKRKILIVLADAFLTLSASNQITAQTALQSQGKIISVQVSEQGISPTQTGNEAISPEQKAFYSSMNDLFKDHHEAEFFIKTYKGLDPKSRELFIKGLVDHYINFFNSASTLACVGIIAKLSDSPSDKIVKSFAYHRWMANSSKGSQAMLSQLIMTLFTGPIKKISLDVYPQEDWFMSTISKIIHHPFRTSVVILAVVLAVYFIKLNSLKSKLSIYQRGLDGPNVKLRRLFRKRIDELTLTPDQKVDVYINALSNSEVDVQVWGVGGLTQLVSLYPHLTEKIKNEIKALQIKSTADKAALADNKNLGGIALNSKMMDLQIRRDGHGVPLSISQQPLGSFNIQGLVPRIISIQPVDLPALFGLTDRR